MFRTKKCRYFSNAYFCQPVKAKEELLEAGEPEAEVEAPEAEAEAPEEQAPEGAGEPTPWNDLLQLHHTPGNASSQPK